MSDSEHSNSEHSEKSTEEDTVDNNINKPVLEKTVKEWVKLDDDIRELEDKIKEKKKLRQEYEEELLKIGDDFCINITGGQLTKTVTVRKAPIQEKQIKDVVSKTEKDPKKVKQLLEDMEQSREVKQKSTIKRVFKKTPKKKETNAAK